MKKLLFTISVLLIIIGISSSAYAYRYGASYAMMDLSSFDLSYKYVNGANGTPEAQSLKSKSNGAVGYYCVGSYPAGYAYTFAEKDSDDDSFHRNSLLRKADFHSGDHFSGVADLGSAVKPEDGFGEDYQADSETVADVIVKDRMEDSRGGKIKTDGSGRIAGRYNKVSGHYGGYDRGGGKDSVHSKRDGSSGDPQALKDASSDESILQPADGQFVDITDTGADNPAPVPEPATMLLLGTGLIGLAGIGRKKFKK